MYMVLVIYEGCIVHLFISLVHSKLDMLHEQLEKGGVKVDTSESTEGSAYSKLPLKKREYSLERCCILYCVHL